MPTDSDGPGGIRLGGLERRMRERWRTVSRLWELNRALANRLNLLGQLDYMGKLSAQLGWQENSGAGRSGLCIPSQENRLLLYWTAALR